MRRILLMLALIVARCGSGGGTLAFAQSCPAGHTLVQDMLYGPVADASGNPTLFFGSVTISANSAGHGANGAAFGRVPLRRDISNGIFTACLIPNDTAVPVNTTYTAKYSYVGDQGAAAPWTETWSVPTSGSPVTLASVRLLTTPPLLQGATGLQGPSGTGNAPYSATVANLTTLYVPASTHSQGTRPTRYCSDATGHAIDCDSSVDAFGNVTYTWPNGFTGSVTILGGGAGPVGPAGPGGPAGPMGSLGSFGPLPAALGCWVPEIYVTAGLTYSYGYGPCGAFSLFVVTDPQLSVATNYQMSIAIN